MSSDALLSERHNANPRTATVEMEADIAPVLPPAMAEVKQQSMDTLLHQMNRMPLFMTELDETDGEGGENAALEAIRALAYEGTRAEIAGNFREYGNEQARVKRWSDAREFYDKAIAALKAPPAEEDSNRIDLAELDPVKEAQKERKIAEASYVNRALCHLELSK
jgi:hypothetical protein